MSRMAIYLRFPWQRRLLYLSPLLLPLPNLGFLLEGFTAFHLDVAIKLVSVAPWGIRSTRDLHPPLWTPPYPGLFFPLAQTLPSSQMVQVWTFLYPKAAAIWAGYLFDLRGVFPEAVKRLLEFLDALKQLNVR